jgi:hypothetical protein
MRSIGFLVSLRCAMVFSFATAITRAEDYTWIRPDFLGDGDYFDPNNWGDPEHPGGPAGPPTSSDNVNLSSGNHRIIVNDPTGAVTLSGNEGATLFLNATYHAVQLTDAVTISGSSGLLTSLDADHAVSDGGPIVDGGALLCEDFECATLEVKNSGQFLGGINIVPLYCTVETSGVATFGNAVDLGCNISGGGQVIVTEGMYNHRNYTVELADTSSVLAIASNLDIAGTYLDITGVDAGPPPDGPTLRVHGSLYLHGDSGSAGGGHWGLNGHNQPGIAIVVGGGIEVGDKKLGDFFLAVFDGAEVNCAELHVTKSSSISVTAGAHVTAGSSEKTFARNAGGGVTPGGVFVTTNGNMGGSGELDGDLTIGAAGRFAPGDRGRFTLQGNYEQDTGSTYYAEIGGTDPETGYDNIYITGGSATLDGTLRVRLVNGFMPTVGQTFRILNANSINGTFAIVSPPSQAGISLTTDSTGVTVNMDSVVAGAPVISSPTTVTATTGSAFDYQITATYNPTSFTATNLPTGLSINSSTGLISGTPVDPGIFIVPISADNAAGSGQADLTINCNPSASTPTPTPTPCNGRCTPTPRPRPTPHRRPTP